MTYKLRSGKIMFVNLALMGLVFASCASSRNSDSSYVYFNQGLDTVLSEQKEITIQPNDLIGIQVFSKTLNQEQTSIFNMPATTGGTETVQGYQVGIDGNIVMPVLGNIQAAGLTKNQLQALIVKQLTDGGFVKAPSVIVRFLQFNVNVIGEVREPGTQKFQVDRVTIIDALSAAGDLTDFGKRDNITVIREESSKKVYYTIDLTRKDVFASPAFIMKPNDIVYVSPTKNKLRTLNRNPNAERGTGLFFSILSTVVGIASIVIYATRK